MNQMHRQEHWLGLLSDANGYYQVASDPEREHLKNWVNGLLREREVIVDFVKSTGEARTMKCTLNESLGAKYSSNENKKKPNPEVCVVWDLNQGAWRSFRWDRLKRITFDIG